MSFIDNSVCENCTVVCSDVCPVYRDIQDMRRAAIETVVTKGYDESDQPAQDDVTNTSDGGDIGQGTGTDQDY